MISVYQKKINNGVTVRDYETYQKYIKLIQWGRKNPVQFIEKVFDVQLMDYQRWLVAQMWVAEYFVVAASRNIGKSFLVGLVIWLDLYCFQNYK